MDQQLNFRADEDLARGLAEAASREERTISAEIRYAVRKHLARIAIFAAASAPPTSPVGTASA